MKYLCLKVCWFDDRYHGKDADGEPEWPPSPLRLFQALVASVYRRVTDREPSIAALNWLQNRNAAPLIYLSRGTR